MGGQKTVGTIYNEAFSLIKAKYKALWVIALVMYGVQMVVGIVVSVFTVPFQFMIPFITTFSARARGGNPEQVLSVLLPIVGLFGLFYLFIIALSIVTGIVQGAAEVAAKNGTLQLVAGEQPKFEAVWQNFARYWKRYVGITAWIMLWTTLWSLLFIVPGIVKSYSFRLAPYLMIEYPDMTVREALKKSIQMTDGYKGRLFVLDLIIIAFSILSIFGLCLFIVGTIAIEILWIYPLTYALFAIAYVDIKKAAIEKGILAPGVVSITSSSV